MALSETQKQLTIFHLGWPSNTIISGNTSYNKTISDRLSNLSAEGESLVSKVLKDLERIEDKLRGASDRFAVSRVEDITINPMERDRLIQERKRYRKDLSQLVDIRIYGGSGNLVVV